VNEEALAHWGLLRQKQTKQTNSQKISRNWTYCHIHFACATALKLDEVNPNTSAVQINVLCVVARVYVVRIDCQVRGTTCAVHTKALFYALLFYTFLL